MPEYHPSDSALLALAEDSVTGVPYIPTGQSPYYLEFRKLLHRLLRACERANDLRVYQDGDLSIGIRAGKCVIDNTPIDFTGRSEIAITPNTTTWLWLDNTGEVQTSTSALSTDRTTCLPLAKVTADDSQIESIEDLRGQAFLQATSLTSLGITAQADEISQALAGISSNVDAVALNLLAGGATSSADGLHQHTQIAYEQPSEASFTILNSSDDPAANIVLRLRLPQILPFASELLIDHNTGYLQQRYGSTAYHMVGCVHPQYQHPGELTASLTDQLVGIVPVDGKISDIILTIGSNIQSSTGTDNITAVAKVNAATLTTTHPSLSSAAGLGTLSTAQGAGTAAVLKADGTQLVQQGDLLTLDLTRTAAGSITNEASDIAVMIVIRANKPA